MIGLDFFSCIRDITRYSIPLDQVEGVHVYVNNPPITLQAWVEFIEMKRRDGSWVKGEPEIFRYLKATQKVVEDQRYYAPSANTAIWATSMDLVNIGGQARSQRIESVCGVPCITGFLAIPKFTLDDNWRGKTRVGKLGVYHSLNGTTTVARLGEDER